MAAWLASSLSSTPYISIEVKRGYLLVQLVMHMRACFARAAVVIDVLAVSVPINRLAM